MIIREERGNGNRYFVAGYDAIGESRLSYKAIGILMYVLSKPDNWEANEDDLVKRHDDGRASVRAGIAELIELGYMYRRRVVDDRGRVIRWLLDTYESPSLNPNFCPQSENQLVEEPECDYPQVENQIMDSPQFGFPQVDFPQVENRTLTITNKELLLNKELKEGEGVSDRVDPQAPPAPNFENSLIVSETNAPKATQGIDPQTLELSRRWSKNAPKPVKVRMSAQQAAIVAAEPPMFDPPSRIQAASFQPPTDNRVISTDDEKIIIQASAWTEMLGAMLDGLGLRDLASAGVVKAKRDAGGTLETLCRMSPKFRTKDGIQELFNSWARARPDYPVPKPAWLEEHASLFLAGKVRYQDEKRTKQHERRSPGSDGNRAVNAEDLYPEYSRFA